MELGVTSDSLWLAGFADPRPGDRVCDLGCGEGIITLELAARIEAHFIGIDISESVVKAAREKMRCQATTLKGEVEFQNMIIQEAPRELGRISFDVVVCNPPFFKSGEGRPSPNPARRRSREECAISLKEIVSIAGELLKNKGTFYCILPPGRLPELMEYCNSADLGSLQIRPVYTKPASSAIRVLCAARKGGKGQTEILTPLQNV